MSSNGLGILILKILEEMAKKSGVNIDSIYSIFYKQMQVELARSWLWLYIAIGTVLISIIGLITIAIIDHRKSKKENGVCYREPFFNARDGFAIAFAVLIFIAIIIGIVQAYDIYQINLNPEKYLYDKILQNLRY